MSGRRETRVLVGLEVDGIAIDLGCERLIFVESG